MTVGLAEAGAVVVFVPCDEDEAAALAEGAGLVVQLAAGVGPLCFAVPDVLARVLELGLTDALAGMLSLGLALPFGLAMTPPVAPLLGLALALTLAVGLAVPLPWDELAGLCGCPVALGLGAGLDDAVDAVDAVDGAGLAVLDFAEPDGCVWDGDRHGPATGLVFPGDALPSTPLAPKARPELPGPAVAAVVLGDPANMSVPACTNAWRSGGTAASTIATANTATAMDSAGRSIASRQSPRCRWARRACPGPVPRPGAVPRPPGTALRPRGALCSPCALDKRRTSLARKPGPPGTPLAPGSESLAEA